MVGNGFCNDATNIAACNFDGGDCCGHNINTNFCSQCNCFHKETCEAGVTNAYVGDGYCDDETNIAACNYDGGDCCGSCIITEYCSNCDCLGGLTNVGITNALVGNGYCDEGTNKTECNYDGGDCCSNSDMVDNGICNDETNNLECNYDGGDCCGPDISCK